MVLGKVVFNCEEQRVVHELVRFQEFSVNLHLVQDGLLLLARKVEDVVALPLENDVPVLQNVSVRRISILIYSSY